MAARLFPEPPLHGSLTCAVGWIWAHEDSWTVRQVLDDPDEDRDWAIHADVDLAASYAQGSAVIRVTGVGPLFAGP